MIEQAKHSEAKRLLAAGMVLCELHPNSKRPVGDGWNNKAVSEVRESAGGYGLLLAKNGICSVDVDNEPLCKVGLQRCGLDLQTIRDLGVWTSSTRPNSGGRVAFKVPVSAHLRWLKFSSKNHGTIMELRAESPNLQDSLPGTTYSSQDGSGPWVQDYAGMCTFDCAPEPSQDLLQWWERMSNDVEYLRGQQALFIGEGVQLSVSSGDGKLAYTSEHRVPYNIANSVVDILERHGYTLHRNGRYAPPTATGAAAVRAIPGRDDLWQSDHASDPLHGTFDAWTAYVVLDCSDDLAHAEDEWKRAYEVAQLEGFDDVPTVPGAPEPLPAFKRTNAGQIRASKENTVLALSRSDVCGFKIRHDTFRSETMIAEHNTEGWRSLRDTDYTELCLRLERGQFQNIPKELIRDAVDYVAAKNAFDSAQHWLNGLIWDGVPRVGLFLEKYLRASDTDYSRAVSMYLWTALAGRVLVPAVKCDMVPVLVGEQGTRKTSSVAAMVPSEDFFTGIDLNAKDDELSRIMRGKLVIELGELRGLASRDAEHIKGFITRGIEEWVPKYREQPVRFSRRCVFMGTSNKRDFLADETGERRWLPFQCGPCDPEAIARDREQLWAEGRNLFMAGGVLFRDAERLAAAEHEAFTSHDEWESAVQEWLSRPDHSGVCPGGRRYLTARAVLFGAMGLPDSQQSAQHQRRIKKVLLRLGYRDVNTMIDGRRQRGYEAPSLF
ncbi:MAG: VapE family protein [Rhodoferax sp.]|nr:VapE family protein [Rhodoferax sp.]